MHPPPLFIPITQSLHSVLSVHKSIFTYPYYAFSIVDISLFLYSLYISISSFIYLILISLFFSKFSFTYIFRITTFHYFYFKYTLYHTFIFTIYKKIIFTYCYFSFHSQLLINDLLYPLLFCLLFPFLLLLDDP